MKNIIVLLAITAVLVTACTQTEYFLPSSDSSATSSISKRIQNAKEDEDKPILQHKIVDFASQPIAGALVLLSNDTNVLFGQSDSQGRYTFRLLDYGIWDLQISSQGYTPLLTKILIADTLTIRVDTLRR